MIFGSGFQFAIYNIPYFYIQVILEPQVCYQKSAFFARVSLDYNKAPVTLIALLIKLLNAVKLLKSLDIYNFNKTCIKSIDMSFLAANGSSIR